jgi:hypothetical protein
MLGSKVSTLSVFFFHDPEARLPRMAERVRCDMMVTYKAF